MAGWIAVSLIIGTILLTLAFQVLGGPSFPHRGELIVILHRVLVGCNALVLWLVIFWVAYETRACARFIETLSGVSNEWPTQLLAQKEKETGVSREHLDDYLDFQLIVRATQRIQWLIYLPFVSILFMVLARQLLRRHAMPRRATHAIGLRGEQIAENEIVACPSPAANRDPAQFDRPHELIFERSPNRHIGFGLGPHRCLGIHLARRELRIALQAFHRRLPDYRLHPTRKPERFGGMKGVASLWLRKD